jgi:hypothetical protein
VDDSTEHRWFFDLLYNPRRTITLDLNYQYWTLDASKNGEDYTSNQVTLVGEKRYKYYAFDAGFGYHYRDFDGPQSGDVDTLAYKVSVIGQNPPPAEKRRYVGSEYLRARSHIYLAAERNFNNLGSTYTADRFSLSTGHVFAEKILTRIYGHYQTNDYDSFTGATSSGKTKKRDEDIYKIAGSIGYLIKKQMAVTLTGGYEDRDSNLAGYDYENEYVMLRFDFNFELSSRGGYLQEGAYYY